MLRCAQRRIRQESGSLPHRQSYWSSVLKGSVPREMERGHSRVSLPWRSFSPFASGTEPRLLPGDTQPRLQSGVAMLLKFWELKWNQKYQEEFSRRHFIREGCTHSSFSIPPSCFLKRCHDESLAAMPDHEKGGLEMVSSSVERNLSHRPPEITNYRLPNGLWLY